MPPENTFAAVDEDESESFSALVFDELRRLTEPVQCPDQQVGVKAAVNWAHRPENAAQIDHLVSRVASKGWESWVRQDCPIELLRDCEQAMVEDLVNEGHLLCYATGAAVAMIRIHRWGMSWTVPTEPQPSREARILQALDAVIDVEERLDTIFAQGEAYAAADAVIDSRGDLNEAARLYSDASVLDADHQRIVNQHLRGTAALRHSFIVEAEEADAPELVNYAFADLDRDARRKLEDQIVDALMDYYRRSGLAGDVFIPELVVILLPLAAASMGLSEPRAA